MHAFDFSLAAEHKTVESMMNVLVIGGAGYIGSHMVRTLAREGIQPWVLDNLSTGHRDFVPRNMRFIKADLCNKEELDMLFAKVHFDAILHFAAASLVGESMQNPMKYYQNNVQGFMNLMDMILKYNVKHLIFSSTAAIYGAPSRVPIDEEDAKNPVNPYGQSKLMIENILKDVSKVHPFTYVALRYFNACGADPLGQVGEEHPVETHLIPNILKVATGDKQNMTVHGSDYPTPDGTCIRDYVDVEDLCNAHLLALRHLLNGGESNAFNLGSGRGYSVKEIIQAVQAVTGKDIPVQIGERRPGDPPVLVASNHKARTVLGWQPKKTLEETILNAWKWETGAGHMKMHLNIGGVSRTAALHSMPTQSVGSH